MSTITKAFTYQRQDGGTTDCYGTLTKSSNFEVTCENEYKDGIASDVDMKNIWNWDQLCAYLEKNYDKHIEEVSAI